MRRALVLFVLLALTACGNPPDEGTGVRSPVVNGTASVAPGVGSYVVQPGDTIYSIAQQLHVSVRSLIDANQMQPPFQVWAGQHLTLPGSGTYVVAKGEYLSGIAKKTGVPFSTLARMNGLTPPYVLQVGQKLLLPASAGTQPSVAGAAPPPTPAPTVAAAPTAAAAPQAAVTVSALPPIGGAAVAATPSAAPLSPASALPPAAAGAVSVPPPAAAAAVSAPISNPTQTAALPPAPLAEPPAKSGRGFIWPLKGEVIAEFGNTGKGQHNDGINIAAPRGTPVLAAESGVVAYAGNELRGFGNLLLIKHEGGWMTAYAHNDALLVKRGDVVKRGQRIAKVGDSGGVSQTQLHFEVRQGTRAVDPATVLGGSSIPASAPLDPPDPG
jgi:murein DD-endopeptidase MepM/ murein hydrolase activator NlpD